MRVSLPVDHIAFGTVDLDRASADVHRAGLSHTAIGEARWPGADRSFRARTISVMLADGYLDIVEFDGAQAVLQPTGVVLRSEDLRAMRRQLTDAGVRCGEPYTIVRTFSDGRTDQRYEIFGIDARHECGLPQSVIRTQPAEPMKNQADHVADVTSLAVAARIFGIELDPGRARSHS